MYKDKINAIALSLRLDAAIHEALLQEAKAQGREIDEHIKRILAKYAFDKKLLEGTSREEIEKRWSLVQRAVEVAISICRRDGFCPEITCKAVHECSQDPQWLADYEFYVRDNAFKHGNPRKTKINREIGNSICKALGARAVKRADGKSKMVHVLGSIIQTYTVLELPRSDEERAETDQA